MKKEWIHMELSFGVKKIKTIVKNRDKTKLINR